MKLFFVVIWAHTFTKLCTNQGMFIPIGGIYVFGGCYTRGCIINRIIMNLFNAIMGALALWIGYSNSLTFLIVVGYIIIGMAVISMLTNLLSLRNVKAEPKGNQ